jgi:hypothetical protein
MEEFTFSIHTRGSKEAVEAEIVSVRDRISREHPNVPILESQIDDLGEGRWLKHISVFADDEDAFFIKMKF